MAVVWGNPWDLRAPSDPGVQARLVRDSLALQARAGSGLSDPWLGAFPPQGIDSRRWFDALAAQPSSPAPSPAIRPYGIAGPLPPAPTPPQPPFPQGIDPQRWRDALAAQPSGSAPSPAIRPYGATAPLGPLPPPPSPPQPPFPQGIDPQRWRDALAAHPSGSAPSPAIRPYGATAPLGPLPPPPSPRLVPGLRLAADPQVLAAATTLGGEPAVRATNPQRLDAAIIGDPSPLPAVSGGVSTASVDAPTLNVDSLGTTVATDVVTNAVMDAAAGTAGEAGSGGRGAAPTGAPRTPRPRPRPRRLLIPRGTTTTAGGQGVLRTVNDAIAAGWHPVRDMSNAVEAFAAGKTPLSQKLLASGAPAIKDALTAAGRLGVTAARWALPVAGTAAAVLPAVTGAMEGYETAGVGGAAIQGGSALTGALAGAALGSFIPVVGTAVGAAIGAGIGAAGGNMIGSGLTRGAVALVDAAESGDQGPMGALGRALDPVIRSTRDGELAAVYKQLNSPAYQAIKQQERDRELKARNAQTEQMLMSYYLS